MGRGFSSSGRGSSSSGRGFSSGGHSHSHHGRSHSHTTVVVGNSYYGGGYSSGGSSTIGYIVLIVMLFLFGFMFGYVGIDNILEGFKYDTVQAVCVDNTQSYGYYYTTYEYTINNEDYKSRSDVGWQFPEEIGATVEIYYEKDNPRNITEEKPVGTAAYISAIVGVVLCGAAVAVIVYVVKLKKKAKNAEDSATVSATPKTIKCAYCGKVLSSSNQTCPNCGGGYREN